MRRRPENFHPSFMIGFPRLRRLRRISRKRNGFSSASVLAGSPGLVLPGRRCRGVVLLVFSWHQLASRSPDAAGGLLHRPGLPPAAVVLVPLDEALWLSGWICGLTDTAEWLHTDSRRCTRATEPTETPDRSGTSATGGSH